MRSSSTARCKLGGGIVNRRPRGAIGVACELGLNETQPKQQDDEALLGAVVQVPLQSLPLGVGGGDDPCPRGPQVPLLGS